MDLITIGIGPSSSHTVGPMRAAAHFSETAVSYGTPERVMCHLFGSLVSTGKGHATDTAILLALSGWLPDRIDPEQIASIFTEMRATHSLNLSGLADIVFDPDRDLLFMMGSFYRNTQMEWSLKPITVLGNRTRQPTSQSEGGRSLALTSLRAAVI